MIDRESKISKFDGNFPTFIIIGAPKAGTTSAYHYLDQHPDVFMSPVKEPHFFSYSKDKVGSKTQSHMHGVTYSLNEYRALFREVNKQKAIGEASTGYLLSPIAAERIAGSIPNVKIVVILRNPADRAFSGYMMQLRNSREKSSLDHAFVRGKVYVENSFYYENLLRYYEFFPREQIGIFLFEEFRKNPIAVMSRIYEFIGVDEKFEPSTHHYHKAWVPKYRYLNDVREFVLRSKQIRDLFSNTPVKSIFRQLTREKPPVFQGEARHKLLDIYRQDIERVEKLIDMDLSFWLNEKSENEIGNKG